MSIRQRCLDVYNRYNLNMTEQPQGSRSVLVLCNKLSNIREIKGEKKKKAYSFMYSQLSQKMVLDISWYAQHFNKLHNITVRIAVKRNAYISTSLQSPIMRRWIHRHSSRHIVLWRSTPSTKHMMQQILSMGAPEPRNHHSNITKRLVRDLCKTRPICGKMSHRFLVLKNKPQCFYCTG